jgi:hypothetical protein
MDGIPSAPDTTKIDALAQSKHARRRQFNNVLVFLMLYVKMHHK